MTFTEMPAAVLLKENIARAGFLRPTPIQASALPLAFEGRDVLGIADTGTGKTLAFLLPILQSLMHKNGHTIEALILVPTRELAQQVFNAMRIMGKGTGIPAALIVGGLSEGRQLDAIRRGARIVIATPGRLYDYVKRNLVALTHVRILVLDEADRMVDMGFLPQMRVIMKNISPQRQTLCFSATMDKAIAPLVHEYLQNPARVEVGSAGKPAESVSLQIYEVVREQKFPLLMHLLEGEQGTFLVFSRTKYGADKIFNKLIQRGIRATLLHGGRTQGQRTQALEGFRQGVYRVLVATDIAARGIHVHGIAHVVNYDMPQVADDFVHRVGRTGRVNAQGIASTFVMPDETRDMRNIERILERKIDRLSLPQNLASDPRSLHDEAYDMRSRHARAFGGSGRFARSRPRRR